MAKKRMFSLGVLDTDAFLDMPLSAQALYFHLNLRADDDGFVGNPKRIAQTIGASIDDLKLLVVKRFVIAFEDGVIVIKHWRMHNVIKKDRYTETNYTDDLKMLDIKDNGAYTLKNGAQLEHKRSANGAQMSQTCSTDIGLDIGLDIVIDNTTNTIEDNGQNLGQNEVIPEVIDQDQIWFDTFWSEYPRKVKKDTARKSFAKVCKTDKDFEAIMAGLKKYIPTWDDPKYIPHPTTWLNQRRWEDENIGVSPKARGGWSFSDL